MKWGNITSRMPRPLSVVLIRQIQVITVFNDSVSAPTCQYPHHLGIPEKSFIVVGKTVPDMKRDGGPASMGNGTLLASLI